MWPTAQHRENLRADAEQVPRSAQKKCGEATKVCRHCRHHKLCHATEGRVCKKFPGPRPACKKAEPDSLACESFEALPCEDRAGPINGRCRRHNGRPLLGAANPNYKGTGYSRYLPDGMLAHYQMVSEDPEWLSLRSEIDLMRTQMSKLVADLGKAEIIPEAIHGAAKACRVEYKAALATQAAMRGASEAQQAQLARQFGLHMTTLSQALDDLKEALSPAAKQDAFRRRSVQLAHSIEKLNRTETRNRFVERGMLTLEQVVLRDDTLIHAWKEALDKEVRDESVRKAILAAVGHIYTQLVGRPQAPALTPARRPEVLDAEYSEARD